MRHLLATLVPAVLGIAALTGAAVLFSAAPAQAHSYLVASTPEAGQTLTDLPDSFSVTANETLLDLGSQGAFALQIQDADGGYYGDGCVSVVDATMSADATLGESGDYTMLWQVVSADGHPVSGEIPFTWSAPDGFEATPSHGTASVCGEDPAPTGEPTETPSGTADAASPWVLPITVVLGVLVVILANRSARIQVRNRAAARGDDPPQPPEV